jgi:DNA invertase Pin-like site-specific DNA recombinase
MSCVHAYVRVSSTHQKDSGYSIENQIAEAISYKNNLLPDVSWSKACTPHGSKLGFYQDLAVSAWKGEKSWLRNRPAGSIMLDNVKRGDHIIFYSIDRGFRNVGDFGMFMNSASTNGWNLHFIKENIDTSTPSGRMMAHVYAAIAEYYSSIQSLRLREAFAVRGSVAKPKPIKKKKLKIFEVAEDVLPASRKEAPVKTPERIILYSRVSTSRQVDTQLGLRSQARELESAAKRILEKHGELEVLKYQDDAQSAFKTPWHKRNTGAELWKNLRAGDHVIVYRFDRAFRSVKDMLLAVEEFDSKGAVLHILNDNIRTDMPSSRMHMNLLAAIAQMESDIKSIRGKELIARRKEQGTYINCNIPRCHKVVTRGNRKMLALDYEALIDYTTMAYLTRERGLSTTSANIWIRHVRAVRMNVKPHIKLGISLLQHVITSLLQSAAQHLDPRVIEEIKEKARAQAYMEFSPEMKASLERSGFSEKVDKKKIKIRTIPI